MSFIDKLPKPFFVLAPMDDVTDTVFRQIVAGCAEPDLYFTEFVNVDGLQSAGREKLLVKLKYSEKERPIIAQIWGKDPKNYEKTARDIVKMGFDGLDLNMGCPDKSICKNGCCAALINDRELAKTIIDTTRKSLGGQLPLSVKTRIGYNQIDLTWIEFLLTKKLNMLSIHARTKKEMSKVPNHWEVFDEIIKMRDKISPGTLIVGNGDIKDRANGEKLAKKYNLDGVMIGRGIFNDPFVFAKKSEWPNWTKRQKTELYTKHIELFAATWQKNERKLITLNKFCKIYINGFSGAKELREQLMIQADVAALLQKLQTPVNKH